MIALIQFFYEHPILSIIIGVGIIIIIIVMFFYYGKDKEEEKRMINQALKAKRVRQKQESQKLKQVK